MSVDTAVNVVLTAILFAFVIALTAVEGFTVYRGIPTISARLQALGQRVRLVQFLATVVTLALLIHFFFGGL